MDPKISANFPLRPPTVPSGSGSRGVREMLLDAEPRRRGDSGDRTASQRRLTLGWKADQDSARRIPQLVWYISMLAGGGKTWTQYTISATFPPPPPTVPSGSGSRGVREMLLD